MLKINFTEIYEHRSLLVQHTEEAIISGPQFGGNKKGGNTTTTTIISSEHINHTQNSSPTPNRQLTDYVNDNINESNTDEIIVDVQKEIKGKFYYLN